MKELRKRFNRFCYTNRNKGIPNLMLYICIGSAIVYIMTMMTQNDILYRLLIFDKNAILHGQVWRLFSYPLTYGYSSGNILLTAIGLLCYYSLGRVIEHQWGTLRFNLFYFTGVILMDIFCLVLPSPYYLRANVTYLNMSLFLAYATLYPNASFLLFFIIPVKAWIFALFDLALTLFDVFANPFPINLFPLVAIANYFLFFGKDVLNIIPLSWRINARKLFRKKGSPSGGKAKVIQFPSAVPYEVKHAAPKADYLHKCTVCGRTDVSNPELEFRYCSRCSGYYCYCEEHISNHTHIE